MYNLLFTFIGLSFSGVLKYQFSEMVAKNHLCRLFHYSYCYWSDTQAPKLLVRPPVSPGHFVHVRRLAEKKRETFSFNSLLVLVVIVNDNY